MGQAEKVFSEIAYTKGSILSKHMEVLSGASYLEGDRRV